MKSAAHHASWRVFVAALAIIFVVAFLSGVGSLSGHDSVLAGCPLMQENAALCALAALSHLMSWKHLFPSVPHVLILLLALVIFVRLSGGGGRDRTFLLHRIFQKAELQPTLFQRLYAQGLLNPKAP